ncbi:MAG: amidohydrolase family protein, partial [Sphingobacteriaceae bacterium]
LMAEYGMKPIDVLRSATSVNAAVFKLQNLGLIKAGFLADLVAVEGNPVNEIKVVKEVRMVWKDGKRVR